MPAGAAIHARLASSADHRIVRLLTAISLQGGWPPFFYNALIRNASFTPIQAFNLVSAAFEACREKGLSILP